MLFLLLHALNAIGGHFDLEKLKTIPQIMLFSLKLEIGRTMLLMKISRNL